MSEPLIVKVLTWNYGFNSAQKFERLVNFLRDPIANVFVIGLQEVQKNEAKDLSLNLKNYAWKSFKLDGAAFEQGSKAFTLLTIVLFRNYFTFFSREEDHVYLESKATFINRVFAPLAKTKERFLF